MTKRLPRPPAAPLIACAAAILASWLGTSSQTIEEQRSPAMPENTGDVGPRVLTLRPSEHKPSSVLAISDRPLLAKGRKPVAPEASVEGVATPEFESGLTTERGEPLTEPFSELPPEVRLLGVIATSESTKALLRNHFDESEQWLAVGDTIQGWALVEITQSAVVLRAGANEISIQMFE